MSSKGYLKTHCKYGHPLSGENVRIYKYKDDGVRRLCRACARIRVHNYRKLHPKPPKIRTHCKKGHELTPENTYIRHQGWRDCIVCMRDGYLKRTFGISNDEYEQMFDNQGRCCANLQCLSTKPGRKGYFIVDHNHSTGKNRQILCHQCNVILGLAKENTKILQGLIEYLQKHTS